MLTSLCIVNKKVREFQYKLMHGAAYLNAQLSKSKLMNTNQCTFCGSQVEAYDHLF